MPARPRLSVDRVVEAAVAVADHGGLAAVSMRSVARELGVEAMSLYHYVASKHALLDALADHVFTLIALPEPGEPWRPATARRASAARAVLAAHPWALGLIESRPTPGPALMHHHDRVLGVLLEAGFPMSQATSAISTIDAFVYGFVLTEQSLPFSAENETADFAAGLAVPDGEHPYLARMMGELFTDRPYVFADEFAIGLELILDAVEARRAAA